MWSVSFSPDGSRIVSGSQDNTVRVWDSQTGVELMKLEGHTSYVTSVSFSPDGSRIVSAGDYTVRVWDAIEYAAMADNDSGSDSSDLFGSDDSDDDERPHHPMVVPPDEKCAICMDNLRDTSNGYAVMLKCGHYFHAECIEGWQKSGQRSSSTCPLCRKKATANEYTDGILRLRF